MIGIWICELAVIMTKKNVKMSEEKKYDERLDKKEVIDS